jgi:subtilisin family serine protease
MRFRFLGALGAFAILGALLLAVSASGGTTDSGGKGLYIVQMALDPVSAYKGGVAGIPATKPGKGQKIDRQSGAVQTYAKHLTSKHDEALAAVGGARKVYDYVYSFNGVAAELTDAQANALRTQKNVIAVFKNETVTIDTSTTPQFLGLDAKKGLWDELGGPKTKANGKKDGAGENIIIGVIDSGIWPESLSFTDQKIKKDKLGKVVYEQVPIGTPPAGWAGTCQTGEQFAASDCNNKLIGARYFNANYGGDAGIDADLPWEFNSPRDFHGHGSHTASTAGGNYGVTATGPTAPFGKISGIAPRARVAAYKALWSNADASQASGGSVDLVAAIETAVADGVDVINYSVSGATTTSLEAVQVAFLFAADAGVFVAASAGNSGPTAGTVAHPSPWLTTVAAGTHPRDGRGSVTIDGVTYTGASWATAVSGALVDAEDSGLAGSPAGFARQCYSGADNGGTPVLDPAKVAGKIVLCDRGGNVLVNKSKAVRAAGGIGMVLTNTPTSGTTILALIHSVPSVHLTVGSAAQYATLHAAADAGKTASIAQATAVVVPAPLTAGFSSRGPSPAAGSDILKPDLIAPGQDILAAVAPPGNQNREFDLYSGTSMSAPHVAGLAALFKQLHPTWSPMAIKSALMTTGTDIIEVFSGTDASDAAALKTFSQGAGHVQPNAAMDPGLVYDSSAIDWVAFMCGSAAGFWDQETCDLVEAEGFSLDAADMNTASIQLGSLAGSRTVTRRVTNVDNKKATYTAAASLNGVQVAVTPSTLTLDPGETKSFQVEFTVGSATLNRFTAGSLTWADKKHTVRIPLVVRPTPLAAPVDAASTNGTTASWSVTPGYTGSLSATVRGMVPAEKTAFNLPEGDFKDIESVVPVGSTYRAGIYEDAITPAGTDLDLYVIRCDDEGCTLAGQSSDGDSNEEVTVTNDGPTEAVYIAEVDGFDTGPAASADVTLYSWVLGSADAGNTVLSGITPAQLGVPQTHTATFTLPTGNRYFGAVVYSNGSSTIGQTFLAVKKD